MNNPITNDRQALALGLALAITAPSEVRFQLVLAMSEEIATRLTPAEVAQSKIDAQRLVAEWNRQTSDFSRN